jgi:hypothetical protein
MAAQNWMLSNEHCEVKPVLLDGANVTDDCVCLFEVCARDTLSYACSIVYQRIHRTIGANRRPDT